MTILEVKNIKKTYESGRSKTEALRNVNFQVEEGEFIAIMGESGSGKTTLLNILSTLDDATEGEVKINSKPISSLKEKEISRFRRNDLGFVFQEFNLLDQFSNRDNVYLPLVLSQTDPKIMKKRLDEISEPLGITSFLDRYPSEISGGQKQRIAIARAIITQPFILFADEPTGNLDSKQAGNIMKLFERINERGQTILMVTHSVISASYAKRVLFIRDGIVFHELYRGEKKREEFADGIIQAQQLINKGGIDVE